MPWGLKTSMDRLKVAALELASAPKIVIETAPVTAPARREMGAAKQQLDAMSLKGE
jgi:hypothetical protein